MNLRKVNEWWEQTGVWYAIGAGLCTDAIAVGYIIGYSAGENNLAKQMASAFTQLGNAAKDLGAK